ncbi:MAG TPA: hypothetical protein VGR20_00845 [Acidimicrobiia bacterium]|nr:hypothetical protein [Acidimicrobiia bacterium]
MRNVVRIGTVAAVLATMTGVGIAGFGSIPRASAELDANSQWAVSSRADAMAIEYLNTAAPVFGTEPVIYGTPASAGSLVDSIGQSNAFSAAPYPGDILVGAADNGNGALNGYGLPGIFSSYPFYVHSEHPIAPDKVQDQSGNRLTAHSEQSMSSSSARSGLITGDTLAALQAQAASRSSVDNTTGQLTAIADSRLDAFKLTDKLQIGRSIAHAKVDLLPGQPLKKESSFTIGSIVVNGVEGSYGDGGFKFGDQSQKSPGDPGPLFDALKQAGITVEILPATGTDTSIESAGLKISQVVDYPAGKQRISFIIGRVSAQIRGEAKPVSDPLLGGLPDAGPTQTSPVVAEAPPTSSAFTSPPEIPSGAPIETDTGFDLAASAAAVPDLSLSPAAGGTAALPPVVAALTPGARTQIAAPEVRLARPASVGRGLRDDDISGFYQALGALGALGALITVGAFVLRGGRRAARAAASGSVLRLPSP